MIPAHPNTPNAIDAQPGPRPATLSEAELVDITGYVQPSSQLRELHRQGFFRARRARFTGRVILERAHYDAVCAGAIPSPNEPQVRPPRTRTP